LTVTDCTITGNSGTGVRNNASATVVDSSVEDNFNGGMFSTSSLTMTGCTISGNSASSSGGGVYNNGTATLTDCTVNDNHAVYGGGMTNAFGVATLTGCSISGNSASSQGGGLNNFGFPGPYGGYLVGTMTATDCTISGNTSNEGGGVFCQDGNTALVACTVSGNTASLAAGIYNYHPNTPSSQVTLTATIVAGDTTPGGQPSEIGGSDPGEVTGSYNLIGTGGSGGLTAANHNLLNVANPGLAPLDDFGGPTETMALLPGSPAIHTGVAVSGITTDQRGFALDSPPDIGAFQSHPGPLVVDTAIDGLGSDLGQLSLRQAVNLADVLTGGATITFDKSAFASKSVIALTAGPLELSNPTGPLKILGPGLGKLAVSGGGASRVFQVDKGSSASLSGLTVTGGFTTGDGGGLLNLGTVIVSGDAIVGNSAVDGGGIANAGTTVILGSSIDGNIAASDGGGIFNTGSLALILSDLSGNTAGSYGGGLYNQGTASLVFSTVDDNAGSAGGGVYADPSGQPVVLVGTEVKRNKGGNISGRVIRL
jgi:fibronectin-binding autotransporter adhesin